LLRTENNGRWNKNIVDTFNVKHLMKSLLEEKKNNVMDVYIVYSTWSIIDPTVGEPIISALSRGPLKVYILIMGLINLDDKILSWQGDNLWQRSLKELTW